MRGRTFSRYGYRVLLVLLLALSVVQPFFHDSADEGIATVVLVTAVLLAALYGTSNNISLFLLGIVLAIPALLLNWLALYDPSFDALNLIFLQLFFTFTLVMLGRHIFAAKQVTEDVLFGSLCFYLLFGLFWALSFSLLEIFHSQSFSGLQNEANPLHRFLYFSLVTLTTLGYGDIVPLTPPARSLATLEALLGQFYLAIVVGRLIGLHLRSHLSEE